MVKTSRTLLLTSAAVVALSVTPHTAMAGPEGGVVVGGSANISQSGTKTDIHQHSNKAILDWRSFDITAQEHVEFHQPSSGAMALNRIRDTKPSQIDGKLTANGHVMLINPNGVVFGSSSQVDVGSLTATTADIENDDFMAGRLDFDQAGKRDAAIINEGSITVKEAGLVNLVAPRVENHGIIQAKLGKVQLSAADTFTLDMVGDGLLQVAVTEEQAAKLTRNTGRISAEGGTIALTASRARSIVDSLVENAGIIEAHSMTKVGGKVILGAGDTGITTNRRILNASGRKNNVQGGQINVLGQHVVIEAGSVIDASGDASAPVSKDKSDTATMTADKGVKTEEAFLADKRRGGGSIKIGGDYLGTGDTPHAQTLYVDANSLTLNDALTHGDGGRTIFWSDHTTDFNGLVLSRGGITGGHGGFLETSGKINLKANGFADLTNTADGFNKGTYLLDPADITVTGGGDSFDTASLEGYWNFEDGAGTTATDLTGTSNGTLQNDAAFDGVSADTGYQNSSSILFDGTGDSVIVGANSAFSSNDDFALSFWFRSTKASGHASFISGGAGNQIFAQGLDAGRIRDSFRDDLGNTPTGGPFVIGGLNEFHDDTWHHIAASYDRSVGLYTTYLDGVLTSTEDASSVIGNVGTTTGFVLGSSHQGYIDDVRIYSSALDADEANELAANVFTVGGLEHMSEFADVILHADNTITLDLQGDTLTLDDNRSITLTTTNSDITSVSSGSIVTNHVASGGNITMTSGGDIDLSGLSLNSQGAGNVSLTTSAGGTLTIDQTIQSGTGDLTLEADEIDINAALTGSGDIRTEIGEDTAGSLMSGDITIIADDWDFNEASSRIETLGNVIFQNRTSGTSIGVGGSAGDLNIDDAELAQFTVGGDLTIGSTTAGDIIIDSVDFTGITSNNVSLLGGDFTIDNAVAAAQTITMIANGDMTLNGSVSASGAGNSVVLVADGFTNTGGAGAINVGAGRYLVYADSPSVTQKDGLAAGNLYGRDYTNDLPASINASFGDRFIYDFQPTLSFNADDITINTFNPNFNSFTYTVSGLEAGDSLSSVFSGNPAFTKSQRSPGIYSINGGLGSLASLIGYDFAFVPGTLTMLSPAQQIPSTVEYQIQTPDSFIAGNNSFTISYAENDFVSTGNTKSDDPSAQKQRVQIKRNNQRINDTSSENDAGVRMVEADLLEIEEPMIEFYDLCSYNLKYCQ